jgi:branched-chain amino acid transport system permease protein
MTDAPAAPAARWPRSRTWIAIGLVALVVYPWVFTQPFPQHIVIMSLLFATLGTAWNIVGGLAGQVSFGHALYFGIGAYTTAWFYKAYGVSALVTWPVAIAIATVAALVVGVPTFRLRGHYFVLASVFIMQAVYIVVANWSALGAAIGLEIPLRKPAGVLDAIWHLQFDTSKLPFYYGVLVLFVAALATFEWIRRSRTGLVLVALREEEDAARSLGVDTLRYKLVALVVSAAFTALCGMFYAQYVLYVEPVSTTSLTISVEIAFIAIFGGIGLLWGPALGAFVIVPLTELLRAYLSGRIGLGLAGGSAGESAFWGALKYYAAGGGGQLDILIYGLMIILIARYQPAGVLGFFRKID